jgi:hypothetical protein
MNSGRLRLLGAALLVARPSWPSGGACLIHGEERIIGFPIIQIAGFHLTHPYESIILIV